MRTTWKPLSNETKPLTFLLALTFLFLFSGSSVVFADINDMGVWETEENQTSISEGNKVDMGVLETEESDVNTNFKNEVEAKPEVDSSGSFTSKVNTFLEDVEFEMNRLWEGVESVFDNASYLVGFFVFFILPFMVPPIRKAIGLVNIILGVIFSMSGIGMIIGVPMIFFGAVLLFI